MKTLFEQIITGELPSKKVFENERILAIHDINPQSPVHVLIITKKVIPSIQEVKTEEMALITEVISVAQSIAKQLGIADSYRLVTNNGSGAGQTIFHLHFHLIGGRSLGCMG